MPHLRGRENILKRYLVHVAAFNLSLVMRLLIGCGTPRGLQDGLRGLAATVSAWIRIWVDLLDRRMHFAVLQMQIRPAPVVA